MTSRRVFIKSGAMAMLSLGFAPSFLTRALAAAGERTRLLIAIFQRGAVDGLNMVVPHGDADYYRLRPSIAIARPGSADGAIDLDGFFGLHPRMAPLEPLWNNGSLAIVHACGSHDPSRSHFDAQDYMETATPGVKSTRDGWLNRYLQASADAAARADRTDLASASHGNTSNPLRGIALARQMPRTLRGRAPTMAFGNVEAVDLRGMDGERAFERAYEDAADARLTSQAREAFEALRTLRSARGAAYQPAAGVEYPRGPFGQALQEIARLAKADVGLEVAFAESDGWDHHVNEGAADGQIAQRLDDFARGLAALAADLGDRLAETVILTMSEFGRAAAENGNRGTDHGHGNAMLILGGPVRGRRVAGRWSGLREDQRFEGRDLAVTTDFRDVFAEVLTRHCAIRPAALARVFPGYTPSSTLDIIRA